MAEHLDPTGIGTQQPGNHREGRRLASAVGTDEAEH